MSVEVGQTIYVAISNMFIETEPKLFEFEVTRVNTVSFYAKEKNANLKYEHRFNKKSMTSRAPGSIYMAYLREEEYWEEIELKDEVVRLRGEITGSLFSLNLEKLRKIKEIIDEGSN